MADGSAPGCHQRSTDSIATRLPLCRASYPLKTCQRSCITVTLAGLKYHTETGETSTLEVGALFVAIGHDPNSGLFAPAVERDASGYIRVRAGSTHTNVDGVFACGDVVDATYRQAVTAAGTGCMAALDCERGLAAIQ